MYCIMTRWIVVFFNNSNPAMPAALQVNQVKAFQEKNLLLFLLSLKSSPSGVSFKVNSWSLCLFSANATQIKKRTSKIKLFCSNSMSERCVQPIRSKYFWRWTNRELVILPSSEAKLSKKCSLYWPISIQKFCLCY